MSEAETSSMTSRRRMLARCVAGAVFAVPASTLAAMQEFDPHPAWLAEVERLKAEIEACPVSEARYPLLERQWDFEARIGEIPTTSLDGVKAQLTLALGFVEPLGEGWAAKPALRNTLIVLLCHKCALYERA